MKNKLLIVDDQPGIRLLLTDILLGAGYQIETAQTGKEAIDKILASTFDLIVLDYHLPILSGKQVIEQMEQAQLNIPVILMSGLIEDINMFEAEHMIIKVIEKPFNIEDLCILVKELTKRQE